jgi:hypothetical protein
MFCTACGTKVPEGSAHCTNCGTKVGGVATAAAIISQNAASAYVAMDEGFKRSVMFGAGSVFFSITAFFVSAIVILFAPIAVGLGIAAMVKGKNLDNPTGYYLGVIGTSAGAITTYAVISAYAIASAVEKIKENMMGSVLGSAF